VSADAGRKIDRDGAKFLLISDGTDATDTLQLRHRPNIIGGVNGTRRSAPSGWRVANVSLMPPPVVAANDRRLVAEVAHEPGRQRLVVSKV